METTVRFSSVNDMENFVSISKKYDFSIILEMEKIKLDAKSVMGLLSLELMKPIKLIAETDDASEYFKEIHDYIVE